MIYKAENLISLKMKSFLKIAAAILLLSVIVFFSYFHNTRLINPVTVGYYKELKQTLKQKGFKDRVLVICTKRNEWINDIFIKISQAEPNSRHLKGEAIDILVFDINSDGKINGKDVDIVYNILDTEIIKDNGGIGAYKNQGLLSRQMVHFDCRGYRAKWNR